MREVLLRMVALLSRLWVRWWWIGLASVGVLLTSLPLLETPGYELSAGLCLVLTFLGCGLGISAARATTSLGADIMAIGGLLATATLPALGVATVGTSLASPCDPFAAVAFVPVLILPTAFLVAALCALAVRWTKRWWTASLLYGGFVGVTAVSTVWPIVFGPQVFAFNHLGGYLPGPLYDEELDVTNALIWFRVASLALAVGLTAAMRNRRWLAVVTLSGFALLEFEGTRLGFRMSDSALEASLGGRVETDELILIYPRGFSDDDVSRILGDLRFRHHQLTEFFGERPPGKVRVWWYRSAAEKLRLVGASHTQFSKPWRREVHVNELGFPHPVIKHELVHAMAAPWGRAPFGVTASLFGFSPHVGVIEGFAVAADNPVDELSIHEWAAAMKKKDLLPDVSSLMTPEGFYGAPSSRAYATAGSFIRFLGDEFGKEKLRALYRDGDFEHAFGQPLEALSARYLTFLDSVALEPDAVNQAFGRFHRGSLFERRCAREVGKLSAQAGAALSIDPQHARELLQRCHALQPDEPSHVLAEAQALRRLGLLDLARQSLDAELVRLEKEPSAWADAALARADLAQEEGDLARARELWLGLKEKQISPAMDRTANVRLEGATLPPAAAEAVRHYFQPGDEDVKLFALRDALQTSPDSVALRYLLARRLQLAGDSAAALPLLEGLLVQELPPSLARETTRLAVEAAFAIGNCDSVRRWATTGLHGKAFDARAADWVARCAFAHP